MDELAADVLVIEDESVCAACGVATGMGRGMGALDDADHPWLALVRRLLALATDRHLPTLVICLGAQLAALALGGRMGRREEPSRGLQGITLTEAGQADAVLSALGSERPTVFHWHQDQIDRKSVV